MLRYGCAKWFVLGIEAATMRVYVYMCVRIWGFRMYVSYCMCACEALNVIS